LTHDCSQLLWCKSKSIVVTIKDSKDSLEEDITKDGEADTLITLKSTKTS
jgi:hypothetical protein